MVSRAMIFKGVTDERRLEEFLRWIQQEKMKELWGDNEDEVWGGTA